MGIPTARNVAPAGSEYAETVRSNHCIELIYISGFLLERNGCELNANASLKIPQEDYYNKKKRVGLSVAQWLEHRTLDRKAWARCPMPPNTLPSAHGIGGVAIYRPFGNFSELNRTVTCMVLKARPTAGVHPAPCHDEFRGPRSDYVRQVAFETTTTEKEDTETRN
ncbi:hypothetical protein TNCV_784391 [Trichonephila clavipes]|nr:hypothetical protein TNCV_784391 [Trichonephila clavipes]